MSEKFTLTKEEFIKSCKIENQRWGTVSRYYQDISYLKSKDSKFWLLDAFSWGHSERGYELW